MILRNGITGFFLHRDIPEFRFADFKMVVMNTTLPIGFHVFEFAERSVTPNFHFAKIQRHRDELWILGHGNYPIIAFADPFPPMPQQIPFRNAASLASRMQTHFPEVVIARPDELSKAIEQTDLDKLNRLEREQVKYWKPTTIGQLAFNYWD